MGTSLTDGLEFLTRSDDPDHHGVVGLIPYWDEPHLKREYFKRKANPDAIYCRMTREDGSKHWFRCTQDAEPSYPFGEGEVVQILGQPYRVIADDEGKETDP